MAYFYGMASSQQGRVTRVTRRYVEVCNEQFQRLRGTLPGETRDVCVGDRVSYQLTAEDDEGHHNLVVEEVLKRDNILQRSDGKRTKQLAANVDLLLIVCRPAAVI